jgi:hypothetical protein
MIWIFGFSIQVGCTVIGKFLVLKFRFLIGRISVQKLVHCCDDFFQFAIQHGVAAIGF